VAGVPASGALVGVDESPHERHYDGDEPDEDEHEREADQPQGEYGYAGSDVAVDHRADPGQEERHEERHGRVLRYYRLDRLRVDAGRVYRPGGRTGARLCVGGPRGPVPVAQQVSLGGTWIPARWVHSHLPSKQPTVRAARRGESTCGFPLPQRPGVTSRGEARRTCWRLRRAIRSRIGGLGAL